MSQSATLEQMISQQVRTGSVLDERTLAALHAVPREEFVPAALRSVAYAECALPLAHGKHMLTPLLVGRILQTLAPRRGERALEIGTGSGYLSACLAALGAQVHSLELHPELAEQAQSNLKAAGTTGVIVATADAMSWSEAGEFDLIVLTASLPVYQSRFEQRLRAGGRLFVVLGQSPVMEGLCIRRTDGAGFQSQRLFETDLEPLEHAPGPPKFEF
jgi:protein-L-isoaspartate(D-aspartate) O-methyltransferase